VLLTTPHNSGALALLEIQDAATGMWVTDQVLKRSPIELLQCRTTEPGKFLLAFTGDVASVEESFAIGMAEAGDALIDSVCLQAAHTSLWRALGSDVEDSESESISTESLLTVECYTIASTIRALDAGLKAAEARVDHLQMADDYGGKGFFVLRGALTALEAVAEATEEAAAERLVAQRIVASPDPALPDVPAEAVHLTLNMTPSSD